MMGFALPDSNLHAPDENLHLPTFFRGIRTSLHFLQQLAATRRPMIVDCHCHAGHGRRADRSVGHRRAARDATCAVRRAPGSTAR